MPASRVHALELLPDDSMQGYTRVRLPVGPGYKRIVRLTDAETGQVIVGCHLPTATVDTPPAMAPSGEAVVWAGTPNQQSIASVRVQYHATPLGSASFKPA